MSMYEADLARPTAVVFGNEAHGLSAESLELADATIRVPIHGRAESLNLAAATALVLFESARQRSAGDGLAGLIGRAAHDIRSPLASLLGFTHTLRARWESLDDDQKRAMVDTMDYDARRMRSLVAQLVDAARLSTGSLGLMLEPVELLEAARKAATEANHPEIPPVEVSGEAVTVVADRKRLATVLDALIEACRWWGEQGPVTISVRAAPHAALEVSRRGSRLDPAEAQDAFAPRTSGTGGGSKVGLFVARGLADAHGASLTVDGGVAVRFTLAFPSA